MRSDAERELFDVFKGGVGCWETVSDMWEGLSGAGRDERDLLEGDAGRG